MAVAPERQRQGIGSRLVKAGLDLCREQGADLVVVLGHADYYPRFGFEPASDAGLFFGDDRSIDPYFMVRELKDGVLAATSGRTRYHPAFDEL